MNKIIINAKNISGKYFFKGVYMEKVNKKVILISVIIIAAALLIVSVTLGVSMSVKHKKNDDWVLHSYGNSVALYKGNEVYEVYSSIVLDTLPETDQKLFNNGILFMTREEAVSAIEDYDG